MHALALRKRFINTYNLQALKAHFSLQEIALFIYLSPTFHIELLRHRDYLQRVFTPQSQLKCHDYDCRS